MLTYESLRTFLENEKRTNKLAELPEDFFAQAHAYLEQKAKLKEGTEDVWEAESARRALSDLLDIREHKILTLALFAVRSGVQPGSLTPSEKDFFTQIVSELKAFRNRRKEDLEGPSEPLTLISFTEDVPEFVALNLKTYGPFKTGDVATIPQPQAELLQKQGKARPIAHRHLNAPQQREVL
ncbi:MAG: hypothetical protein KKA90_04160 [Nanoarchaeota archaeon]|nr:hypothetical protein [Nanoarchaeota archaeon]